MSTPHQTTLLIVDPDIDYLQWAKGHLAAKGLQVLCCDCSDKALKVFEKISVDVLLTEIILSPMDGIALLGEVRAKSPQTRVILTTDFPSSTHLLEGMQKGAWDILNKESMPFVLRSSIEKVLLECEQGRNTTISKVSHPMQDTLIGQSPVFYEVLKVVGKVAPTEVPVLVSGESGTGKELIAKALHQYSKRAHKPFVILNCAALAESLLESELFGHEKGAFTGASTRREGLFESCDGGTLFLDEIGDMPMALQVKLLRTLQDGSFMRVGSHEVQKTNVRIIAATLRDLSQEVDKQRFRQDLFYRLNVVEIHLPPLRHRKEDIPLLANHFLKKNAQYKGIPARQLSQEALEVLKEHPWRGNIRELENTLARSAALSNQEVMLSKDIIFLPSISFAPHPLTQEDKE